MIIKKLLIIVILINTTSINEIYAYNNNESICFDYDDIDNLNHIISNKINPILHLILNL